MTYQNLRQIFFLILIWNGCLPTSSAYAILSHEAIIDETWEDQIRPLLLKKYPHATDAQLTEAHSYLYGGSVLPDIGYFPLGSALFSNLVHYVRTGDFVNNLLEEAQDLNEYAFALGFLCHYTADRYGHPLGTNKAVPHLFPCAMKKYGPEVSYEQAEKYHTRTEFSFDVFQVANGEYQPNAYHDFVGFKISQPVLERAFLKTYGLEIADIFTSFDTAEGIFRFSVRKLFPALTKASWKLNQGKLEEEGVSTSKHDYIYRTDRNKYNMDYGKPGMKSMGLAFFILILPKIGPLSILRIKVPDEKVETIFRESFDEIVKQYKKSLNGLHAHRPAFENINWDTGETTAPGEYELGDMTHFDLLMALEKKDFENVSPELQSSLVSFFGEKEKLHKPCRKKRNWKKITAALANMEGRE